MNENLVCAKCGDGHIDLGDFMKRKNFLEKKYHRKSTFAKTTRGGGG